MNLNIGYLLKKTYITYQSQEIEVFEFVDYVVAICFTNSDGEYLCNVVSGNKAGIYAYGLTQQKTNANYVFVCDSLRDAIKINHNSVNFVEIRKRKIAETSKYYVRSEESDNLQELWNLDIIDALENRNLYNKLEIENEKLENKNDITSMYSSIKQTIISQDNQIKAILTSLFKNQKVIESDLDIEFIAKLKENILIYGPTGTGKTEILKRISKLYDIPMVIEDATSLSETGYVGRKITDMLEDLCLVADGDVKKAEKGILVIDEFDKLSEKNSRDETHVSRLGVQRSLLKLLDGSKFYFENKQFDTSRLTVVGVGAFTGITSDDDYNRITTENFIEYGIMRELIGRFSKTIAMNPLLKPDIIEILKKSNFSPLYTYQKLFEKLQIEFEFDDEFIEYIASLALTKNSGARSLKTVFDSCISEALFKIFAGEYRKISLVKPEENEKPYVLMKK